jgi:hypothetical protein
VAAGANQPDVVGMTQLLTDSLTVVTDYVHALVLTNKDTLGLADVWYGDRGKFPNYPCATVEAGGKTRELNGAPRKTLVELEVGIVVFHGEVRLLEDNYRDSVLQAEAVEALIHMDKDLGGNVVHAMVTRFDPGYANRGGLLRATRLTINATSQKMLPYPGGA